MSSDIGPDEERDARLVANELSKTLHTLIERVEQVTGWVVFVIHMDRSQSPGIHVEIGIPKKIEPN